MSSNRLALTAAMALAAALSTAPRAADLPLASIDFPKDSPVALLSADYTGSNQTARGGAMVLDLRAALTLRNISPARIRGITLLVEARAVTPGGKASVTLPSLSVGPGESFPVRLDLRLLRPVQALGSGGVTVHLDGILFDDLTFFGPDRLNSRRALLVYEMEARRDRRYYQSLLEAGVERLRQGVLASLARGPSQQGMEAQVVHTGRATNVVPGRELAFNFVPLPGSPVEPEEGVAIVAGGEARTPRLEVRNRSARTVRWVELGWIVRDRQGRETPAGTIPADVFLAPGEQRDILKDVTLRFPSRPGSPADIAGLTAYVTSVEFADGNLWVPTRADLSDPRLSRVLAPSPEEQRLLEIYLKHGLAALAGELRHP